MSNSYPEFAISSALVDKYSRYIESPVQRLKFLDSVLKPKPSRLNSAARMLRALPVASSFQDRAYLVMELARFLPPGRKLPLALRIGIFMARMRFVVYTVCLTLAVALVGSSVYLFARIVSNLSTSTEAKEAAALNQATAAGPGTDSALNQVASKAELPLDKVWLADKGDGFEFYSNGARVLTEFETSGRERNFYKFHFSDKSGSKFESVLSSRPVGIVFHISESDKLPFDHDYNSSLQSVSRQLLEYARNHQLYNYIIDRFGRIYRIVKDEDAANHAGHSLWADADNFYINLNSSFIGVCFEGKSSRGSAVGPDGINEAQIYAARILTAVLRSKYGISDADCVTHGLVSVNPQNGLLGYHTDWVSQFPFEAIGLADKYKAEMTAISRFGFTYDQAYLASAGGSRWTGLDQAQTTLSEAARQDGLGIEAERNNRFKIFQMAYRMEHALDKSGDSGDQDGDAGLTD